MRRVMLSINPNKPMVYRAVSDCEALCRAKGFEPIFLETDRAALAQALPELAARARFLPAPIAGEIDAIFVFGGDGTMLRALDTYVACDIPMLGINLGRLGFLLETQTQELPAALDALASGAYTIERRMMLQVRAVCGGQPIEAYATNEVCISRGLSQRMIALDALVGDTLVDHYIADGLVLASPTGSTAYSLSAGGPIVTPDVQCFVLNPICSHSLQSRPIILSPEARVTLRVNMKEMREGISLSVDGQAMGTMNNRDQVCICRSPHDALLIRFPRERNYFALLKDKLSQWSL